jgi:serine/threonine-protein kinase
LRAALASTTRGLRRSSIGPNLAYPGWHAACFFSVAREMVDSEAAHGRLGSLVDGMRLLGVLGQGASATVFRAMHPEHGEVALKILDRKLATNDQVVRRFAREARVLDAIVHPVAVPVLKRGTTDLGEPYLVLRLLFGCDLEDHVIAHGPSVAEALIVADRVLDLLSQVHKMGVLHRDIKPQNVFVERSGAIRVLDFGVARAKAPNESSLTAIGMLLGTPGYMSPEQARGEIDIDARSDLWAVGAVLFFMLTGRPVRSAETALCEVALAAKTPAPALADFVPGVDPALAELVDRALSFDRTARFQRADAMRAAVRAAYTRLFRGQIPSRLGTGSERRRHERFPSAFAVGLHARRGPRVGVCRSYGQRGLLVATPSRFACGERLFVELPASCTGSTPIRASGKVVRTMSDDGSGVLSELAAIHLDEPLPSSAHRRIVGLQTLTPDPGDG